MKSVRSSAGLYWTAALSGLLLTLAAPPSPVPLLALGALAPWAAAVAVAARASVPPLNVARSGAVLFGVHWGLLLLWVPRLVPRVGVWVVPAYLGQVALLALVGAAVGLVLGHMVGRARAPLPLALALAWTAGEWLRGSALGPLDFPWMGIAVPLAGVPELVQGAAWVGERGLAMGAAAVNGALALVLLQPAARSPLQRARPAFVAGVAILTLWVAGATRLARLAPEPVFVALAVQPAVSLEVKRTRGVLALAQQVAALDALVPDTTLGDVDLVVTPETALPVVLDAPDAEGLRRTVAGWVARTGVPVAVGAYGHAPGGGRTNSLFLAGPDAATGWSRADKSRLVPGVEWVPGDPEGLRAGERPALLDVTGVGRVGVLVCIESAGSEPARGLARSGARALVNVTNDAWLGDAPRWTRTAAFHQHPVHLRLRSIETGLGALRVGNGGWTSVVDPGGRETRLLDPWVPGAVRARVASLRAPTLFSRTGDLVGPTAAFAAMVVLVLGAGPAITRR